MERVGNNEYVINVDNDGHPILVKEFPKLYPQPIECKGSMLYAEAEHSKLVDSPIPHETQVLGVVWVDRHVIKG